MVINIRHRSNAMISAKDYQAFKEWSFSYRPINIFLGYTSRKSDDVAFVGPLIMVEATVDGLEDMLNVFFLLEKNSLCT